LRRILHPNQRKKEIATANLTDKSLLKLSVFKARFFRQNAYLAHIYFCIYLESVIFTDIAPLGQTSTHLPQP